jgi:hypothetical protein
VQLFVRKFATTHAADMSANFRPAALAACRTDFGEKTRLIRHIEHGQLI